MGTEHHTQQVFLFNSGTPTASYITYWTYFSFSYSIFEFSAKKKARPLFRRTKGTCKPVLHESWTRKDTTPLCFQTQGYRLYLCDHPRLPEFSIRVASFIVQAIHEISHSIINGTLFQTTAVTLTAQCKYIPVIVIFQANSRVKTAIFQSDRSTSPFNAESGRTKPRLTCFALKKSLCQLYDGHDALFHISVLDLFVQTCVYCSLVQIDPHLNRSLACFSCF